MPDFSEPTAVSPQEPIEKSNPFSVPFRIENTGYWSFHVDHIFAYADRITIRQINMPSMTYHWPDWNNFDLERSESKTVTARFVRSVAVPPDVPDTADIAIVVDFRPYAWFPHSFRRYYRFTGTYIDNWQWLAQPSGPIQANADREIEEHMREIPSSK
jgi:hypothetical protein